MKSTRRIILELMLEHKTPLSISYISKIIAMTESAVRTCVSRLLIKDEVCRSPFKVCAKEKSGRYDYYVFWASDTASLSLKSKSEILQEKIVVELKKGSGFTTVSLSKKLGISKQAVSWHLDILFKDGVISRKDKGIRYPVTGGITRGYIFYVGEDCLTIETVKAKKENVFVAKQDRVTKSLIERRLILDNAFGISA